MWDNITPLQLLRAMPKVLEDEHLEKLQNLFEADKYKNQLINDNADLCGQYAPFCNACDKENEFPCARAYVNFMKSQGMDVEIASEVQDNEEAVDEISDTESPSIEEERADEENVSDTKTRIRIAIARKKTLL